MSDAKPRLRRLTRRQRAQQPWWCSGTFNIDQFPDVLGLNRHECQLQREHYGLHLCWCGLAFDDDGCQFEARPLPGFDSRWQPGEITHWEKLGSRPAWK